MQVNLRRPPVLRMPRSGYAPALTAALPAHRGSSVRRIKQLRALVHEWHT